MKIVLVTNRHLTRMNYFNLIEETLKAGLDMLILREKDLGYGELFPLALRIKELTDKYRVPLVVNGNLQVAERVDAYAYHIAYDRFLREGKNYKKVGVSVHSIEEAKIAEELGADYLLVGHIFETECKKGIKGRGLEFLRSLYRNVKIPIIAIGGIDDKNKSLIAKLGVEAIGLMSYLMSSENPRLSMENLKEE